MPPVLAIPEEKKGRKVGHAYALRSTDPGRDAWAGVLECLDRHRPRRYRLRLTAAGQWRCTCPHWQNRLRKLGADCKHITHVKEHLHMSDNSLATKSSGKASPPAVREPAAPPHPLAPLAAALAAAQQKCRAVPKEANNSFHRYRYASAEAVIAEAKAALCDSGLALVPVEQSLNGQSGSWELTRKFLLLHASGESLPLMVAWPVVPDKGRPLDKATAGAATVSLSYLLRDLLLMPRVEAEDEPDAPDDRAYEPPAPRPATRPEPAAAAEPPGVRLQKRLLLTEGDLVKERLCRPGDLLEAVRGEGRQRKLPADVADWPGDAEGWITEYVTDFKAARRRAAARAS